MLKFKPKSKPRANIFFAIFVIISLVSTLTILVYNNIGILNNNFITGSNKNDHASIIYEKGDIIINSVKKYNTNGNGFIDTIGCPQDITMSGSTMSGSSISTTLIYSNGKAYCSGNYNSSEFRIYFDETYSSFLQSFYKNDILGIVFNVSDFIGVRSFNDSDSTQISFTTTGVGSDNIDDNFNSDNYRVDSQSGTYYPNGYQDDDVNPRKVIVGRVGPGVKNENIFWNNYKTDNIIDSNLNNNDNLTLKAGDVTDAVLYLELSNEIENNFDLTIFEFDKTKYTSYRELFPTKKIFGDTLVGSHGYIQSNSGFLSLSKTLNGNQFLFDFKNKDYGIFVSNNTTGNIVYRLSAESEYGTGTYITPVNDSQTGVIEVISNNIILDEQNNFYGENLKIINKK